MKVPCTKSVVLFGNFCPRCLAISNNAGVITGWKASLGGKIVPIATKITKSPIVGERHLFAKSLIAERNCSEISIGNGFASECISVANKRLVFWITWIVENLGCSRIEDSSRARVGSLHGDRHFSF